jgi:spore coat protein SA
MDNTKIVFVAAELLPMPPKKGGAVEHWIEKVAHSISNGKVYIMSCTDCGQSEFETICGIDYLRFRKGFFAKLLLISYKLPFKNEASRLWQFPYSLWCAWKIRKIRPDIIHIHNRPHFVWIISLLNQHSHIVLHIHQVSAINDCKILWDKQLFTRVDLFLGSSSFISEYIAEKFPQIADKTSFVYNAVSVELYDSALHCSNNLRDKLSIPYNSCIILYSGRLTENKGCHLLIEAFSNIVFKKPTLLLICGGTGYSEMRRTPYLDKLKNLANNNPNIIFQGFVNASSMRDYYVASDIVVIPSQVPEGFCFVTIEAIASGNKIISTSVGALPEILTRFKGTEIVSQNNSEGIKGALMSVMEYSLTSKEIKHNQAILEEFFSWTAVVSKLSDLYRRIICVQR